MFYLDVFDENELKIKVVGNESNFYGYHTQKKILDPEAIL